MHEQSRHDHAPGTDVPYAAPDVHDLLRELTALRAELAAQAVDARDRVDAAHPDHRASACNLLHYLALRRRDLRALQPRLAMLGLSSLGRAEAHVLATLDAVLAALHRLAGQPQPPQSSHADDCPADFATGPAWVDDHTDALLGPPPSGRHVRIMVTMPTAAADDYTLVHDLLARGMDVIRINCAHDDPDTWGHIIDNLRRAERTLGRTC